MSFNDGPGSTAYYGYAIYGQNVYGESITPLATGIVYTIQSGYCPEYLRFQFSGINLGLYIFYINPSQYDAYPQRDTQGYQVITNFNPTFDEDYNKMEIQMSWDRMPEDMWKSIYPYSRKKVDGTSETLYFWDGEIGRFKENKIKVEALTAEVRAGIEPIDRFNVKMKLRVTQ